MNAFFDGLIQTHLDAQTYIKDLTMDPNVTLAELRALLLSPNYPVALDDSWDSAAVLFEALDEWLSKGGFLPTAWDVNSNH